MFPPIEIQKAHDGILPYFPAVILAPRSCFGFREGHSGSRVYSLVARYFLMHAMGTMRFRKPFDGSILALSSEVPTGFGSPYSDSFTAKDLQRLELGMNGLKRSFPEQSEPLRRGRRFAPLCRSAQRKKISAGGREEDAQALSELRAHVLRCTPVEQRE